MFLRMGLIGPDGNSVRATPISGAIVEATRRTAGIAAATYDGLHSGRLEEDPHVKEKLRTVGLHPILPALAAIVGAVAGVFGTIYTSAIRAVFPFAIHYGPIAWPAVFFWLLVIVFGLGFGLSTWAQSDATAQALKELQKLSDETRAAQNNLESLIRTLPPEGFLRKHEKYYEISVRATIGVIGSNDVNLERVIGAVHVLLANLASLARDFDRADEGAVYCANIMLFHRQKDLASIPNIRSRLRFFEAGMSLDSLAGGLELLPDLSIQVGAEGPSAASDVIPAIVLPIPAKNLRDDKGKTTVLPGAPEAFCLTIGYARYEDTSTLGVWCRTKSGLRGSVADDIEGYFGPTGEGRAIRSFASFVFGRPRSEEKHLRPLGVINLHSNQTGILGKTTSDDGRKLFMPLTAPYRFLLWMLVNQYNELRKSKP